MNIDTKTLFVEERATFEKHRRAWVRQGRTAEWAVVSGAEVFGLFDTSGDAWRAAIAHYGKPGFMLKQIFADDMHPVLARRAPTRPRRRS